MEFDSLLAFQCHVENLPLAERDAFILGNLGVMRELQALDDDGELELVDEGTVACCSNPEMVYVENVHDEVCRSCGAASHMAAECVSNRTVHWELRSHSFIVTKSKYERLSHFKAYIASVQGGPVNLPSDVVRYLKSEIDVPSEYTVKAALRKRKLMRYYHHCKYIAIKLGARDNLPQLTSQQSIVLQNAFLQHSTAFDRMRDAGATNGRRNFLSYNFILRQLCIKFNYTHMLPVIPLLKGKKTRQQQQLIWNGITKYI
jgi:hypothetical protein